MSGDPKIVLDEAYMDLKWLQRNKPEVFAATARVLNALAEPTPQEVAGWLATDEQSAAADRAREVSSNAEVTARADATASDNRKGLTDVGP